jgi:ectoine hydroxylase-related dioxygenase (phytanoyl-CoA dioxygenase family)/N-acyl-L-homoserine lactone synthetase
MFRAVSREGAHGDAFDTSESVYLIATDKNSGKHLGSLRLLPTREPHMLAGPMRALLDGDPTPDAWEFSRLTIDGGSVGAERTDLMRALLAGLAEFCVTAGVDTLVGIAEASDITFLLSAGWDCRPLGLPTVVAGREFGAIEVRPTADASKRILGTQQKHDGSLLDGVSPTELRNLVRPPSRWTEELLQNGYCIVRDVMPRTEVDALYGDLKERFAHTPFSEGDFYGTRTKRFGGVLKRSPHAAEFVMHPEILAIADRVLGPNCDRFNLNLMQALEIHPGEAEQPPHRDQDMWRAQAGSMEYLINVMWAFTPYTSSNGGTVLWPGSHRGPLEARPDRSKAISAEFDPGSALVFLGSTLHGGGANRSNAQRAGMIVSYCLGWLKPYENQWLAYPPHIAKTFSPELAALVGYQLHRPNLGNYDGNCPSILLRDDIPEYLGHADSLRPEQIEPARMFKERQRKSAV